jgi:hypothetical protein
MIFRRLPNFRDPPHGTRVEGSLASAPARTRLLATGDNPKSPFVTATGVYSCLPRI